MTTRRGEAAPLEDDALRAAMIEYQQGQLEAFERLYAGLAPQLRGYLLGVTRDEALAKDLLQDTFMQIHRSRHTYRPDSPVRPWAFAIARHVYLMHRRAQGRRLRREAAAANERSRSAGHHASDDAFIEHDRLTRALADLPKDRREAILLHHVAGHSFKEIAARLGIHAGAAKVRASRGVAALRALLGPEKGPSK